MSKQEAIWSVENEIAHIEGKLESTYTEEVLSNVQISFLKLELKNLYNRLYEIEREDD